jgi:hypothetical protein
MRRLVMVRKQDTVGAATSTADQSSIPYSVMLLARFQVISVAVDLRVHLPWTQVWSKWKILASTQTWDTSPGEGQPAPLSE